MTASLEKRGLQLIVSLAALIPISAGLAGILIGPDFLSGVDDPPARDLDSHFRYLSGLFLVMGLGVASCVPDIENKGTRFQLFCLMIFVGGVARALSAVEYGLPSAGHRLGLGMELVVTPLLVLWQARIARRLRPQPDD
jgi:hypothetical protein